MNGFADLLRSRVTCTALAGAGLLHVALTAIHGTGWPCPFLATTGLPCPGCGLGSALAAFAQGHWRQGLATHAFAPLAVPALLLVLLCAILPPASAEWIASSVDSMERKTHFSTIVLVAVILYWAIRIAP